jgi:hypothetical protein
MMSCGLVVGRRTPYAIHTYLSVDEEQAAAEVVHVGEHRANPVGGGLLLRQAKVPIGVCVWV